MKDFQLQDRPHTVHKTTTIQGHYPLRTETDIDVHIKFKPAQQLNSIKYSLASSHIRWLNGELTNILRTISALIIRKLATPEVHVLHDILARCGWW
jgi:hypothetical protein